jgi:dephospho-CoA kinase
MGKTIRLGLTGGIGSGKSTVAGMLADLGATVVDADAISRAVTAPGGAAIGPLKDAFGAGMVSPEGGLDRDAMRELVFADPTARRRLEEIVHPLVGAAIAAHTEAALAAGARCVVLDIPLLVESGRWRKALDRVLVVDCQEETQCARVSARSALAPTAVRQIVAAQAPRLTRLAAADYVIFNDGISIEQLGRTVGQLAPEFGL